MQNQLFPLETSEETTLLFVSAAEAATEALPAAGTLMTATEDTLPTTRAVTDLLTHTQRKIRRRKHLVWAFIAAFNVAPILDWFCSWMTSNYNEWHIAHQSLWTLLLLGPIVPLAVFMVICLRTAKIDANELMRVGGKRAIPALLDVIMGNMSKADHKTYIHCLTILLPQLQAADAPLLTHRHRRKLNTLLKSNRLGDTWVSANQELVAPLLKAYGQVGDASVLPLVEQLANRRPCNDRERQIQQAAQQCLTLLRARVSRLEPKQTLLRAAAASVPTPEGELLRPASPD